VKFYSTGMLVRLGFSSAVAADPDLLIVDEVLSVGDVAFQSRSFDRMLELRENGATLLVVSHNLQAVRRLTDKALVLNGGEVSFQGTTDDAISEYHEVLKSTVGPLTKEHQDPSEVVTVLSFDMIGEDGVPTANVTTGETVSCVLRVRFDQPVEQAVFGMSIVTETGQFAYAEYSNEAESRSYGAGEQRAFTIRVPMRLVSGSYIAAAGVRWGSVPKHTVVGPRKPFYVSGRPLVGGVVDLAASFDVTDEIGWGEAPPALRTEPRDQR
jgi:homopolymeric O-antigen transport system ATP-binding protein